MKKVKKWIQCFALAAFLIAPLAACNTVEGLGQDTKAAGEALSDVAKDTKGY